MITLLAIAGWPGAVGAAKSTKASATSSCTVDAPANREMRQSDTVIRRKPKALLARAQTHDLGTNAQRETSTLTVRRDVVLQRDIDVASSGTVVTTWQFGKGFKGIGRIQVVHAPSSSRVTVDGRSVSTAGLQAQPPALVFDDGKPAPKLRVKHAVVRLLRKASKIESQPFPACASATPAGAGITSSSGLQNPFDTPCDSCWSVCFLKDFACEAATVGVTDIISILDSDFGCGSGLQDCTNNCNAPGNVCCEFHCGNACCGVDASPSDTACAGASPINPGQCCGLNELCGNFCCQGICADPRTGTCCGGGEVACGTTCCGGPALGGRCGDPATNLCCPAAATGDACGGTCCPAGQRCAVPDPDPFAIQCITCPPDKTGPVCNGRCCGPNEVCDGGACCTPDQLCGGVCCAPGDCLNGTSCCAPPNHQCGGGCCAPFSPCCNGVCCAGTSDVCVGGSCCPLERECGSTCCPAGYACTDPRTGTCLACPAAESPCPAGQGDPMCCASTKSCCGNGTCCGAGEDCCVQGGVLGCYPAQFCGPK